MSFIRKLDNSPFSSFFSTEDQRIPPVQERDEPSLKRKKESDQEQARHTPRTCVHSKQDEYIDDLFDRILSGKTDFFEHPTDDLNIEDFLVRQGTPDLSEVETISETMPLQTNTLQTNPIEFPISSKPYINIDSFLFREGTPDLSEIEAILEAAPDISSLQSNPTELPVLSEAYTETHPAPVSYKDENSFDIENERHLGVHQMLSTIETAPPKKYRKILPKPVLLTPNRATYRKIPEYPINYSERFQQVLPELAPYTSGMTNFTSRPETVREFKRKQQLIKQAQIQQELTPTQSKK